MNESINELLREARSALKNSYSPYSRFGVGAAIRTEDGRIFTGTNIENASFSLTICAEKVATGWTIVSIGSPWDSIDVKVCCPLVATQDL